MRARGYSATAAVSKAIEAAPSPLQLRRHRARAPLPKSIAGVLDNTQQDSGAQLRKLPAMANDRLEISVLPAPCPKCGANAPLGACHSCGYLSDGARAFLDGLAEIIAKDILRRIADGELILHRNPNKEFLLEEVPLST